MNAPRIAVRGARDDAAASMHRAPLRASAVLSIVALAVIATACSSTSAVPPPLDPTDLPSLPLGEFAGLSARDTTFDTRSPDSGWANGDEVVFAMRFTRGVDVHRWVLRLASTSDQDAVRRLEASTPESEGQQTDGPRGEKSWDWKWTKHGEERHLSARSSLLPITATVHDGTGRLLSSSSVRLPAQLLARGVLPAIDSVRALTATDASGTSRADANDGADVDEATLRPLMEATIAMMTLLEVIQQDDALAERFWQVVEKPSVWSVITGLGVTARLSLAFDRAAAVPAVPPHLPSGERTFVVPLQIEVNGSPALFVDLVATDAARPFSLCGGVIAATARHPSRTDTRLELQLIGARLGKR